MNSVWKWRRPRAHMSAYGVGAIRSCYGCVMRMDAHVEHESSASAVPNSHCGHTTIIASLLYASCFSESSPGPEEGKSR